MQGPPVAPDGAADPLPNPRHEAFCRLVASGMGHAQAYREAGYGSRTPDAAAAQLLRSASIAARVAYLEYDKLATARAASLVDSHRIQQELECLATADLTEAFEEAVDPHDGTIVPRMKPLTRWPTPLKRALHKVKVRRYLEGMGENAREVEVLEFQLTPKVPAIHELRAHLGLLKPRDVNVTVRGVIALPVMQVPAPTMADRVIDGDVSEAEVAQVVVPPREKAEQARRALLARIEGPR
ncbi:terminase small subunit [Gemmatimonas sp. UBA7669]|uniref:terminase small subunit n=1 Tax=Gemmatimonas sp. UBA7669 TaxID=1946568 RepID=UPI0025C6F716|nr:terminase small subunit [Gemmatimonas sp. UBA7669]